jgi:hypothetical protein
MADSNYLANTAVGFFSPVSAHIHYSYSGLRVK